MRQLATIQKITEFVPIEGADRIVLARMEKVNWEVIVQKDLHKVGDFVLYFEPDTIFDPTQSWMEDIKNDLSFLEKSNWRVSRLKLKGVYSQGLIFPLNHAKKALPFWIFFLLNIPFIKELFNNLEVTKYLPGITKYEPKQINAGKFGLGKMAVKAEFPTHICPKTDETRLDGDKKLLKEFCEFSEKGEKFYIALKYDGTSTTAWLDKDLNLCIASRNLQLSPDVKDNVYWRMAEKIGLKEKLEKSYAAGKPIALQGELCGPSVQGNKLGLTDIEYRVFNIWDLREHRKLLSLEEMKSTCEELGLDMVQILQDDFTFSPDNKISYYHDLAKGNYPNNKPREGIVIRPVRPLISRFLGTYLSGKIINPDFKE